MAGTVFCNIAAAVLDVFTFTLLIPFLDKLFNQPSQTTGISELQQRIIGPFLKDGLRFESQAFGSSCVSRNGQSAATENGR